MILFYFLVSLMPFTDPPLLHYLAGDATFKLLGALCALYALLYLGRRKVFPPYFATWQSRFIMLFYLIAALSFLTKGLQPFTQSTLLIYSSQVILFFVTLSIVDSIQRLRWVLISASAAVSFGCLWVIREWITFRNVYTGFRPGWSVGDANDFSVSAILCLPFMFLRLRNAEARWEKRFYKVALLLAAVALTLCASRGGFLGFIAAFLVVVWRSQHRVRNLALIGLLALVPSIALPNSPIHRFLQPTHSETESNQNRVAAWKAGWRMVKAHPMAGVGLGNFKELMPRYTDPGVNVDTISHNSYIEVAAEMGIPQLLVFVGIVFFSYRSFEQTRRKVQHSNAKLLYDAALGLEAGLIGHAAGALTMSAEYQKLFWLVLCLSMCLSALVRDVAPADEKRLGRGLAAAWERTPAQALSTGSWRRARFPAK
jgi:O-antigen ligase